MARSPRRPAPRGAAPADPLEAELRARLAGGDVKGAATAAIRGYGPELLGYLRKLLGDEHDAREAFAQASERLWRGLAEFRGEAALRTWAYHLAWSAAADLRKEAYRARGRRLETEEAAALPAPAPTTSRLRVERQRRTLAQVRQALPLEDQALLQLRIDQGLTWAECAAVLARDGAAPRPDALMKRFERLKAKLAELVNGDDAS
jgi:RNA polymerase sigma-70 factor (ECF subfamily)